MIKIMNKLGGGDSFQDLKLEEDGMKLTLQPGSFKLGSTDYELAEAEEWTATTREFDVHVKGVLAEVSEEIRLVVIEGAEELPSFHFDDHPEMKALADVFRFWMPAGAISLADVEITLFSVQSLNAKRAEKEEARLKERRDMDLQHMEEMKKFRAERAAKKEAASKKAEEAKGDRSNG